MSGWEKLRGGMSSPTRRAFLGGAAAVVALPWLETIARSTADQPPAVAPPLRAMFWFVPNGMRMDRFVPVDTGAAYTMPELLLPIEDKRSKVLVLSNVAQAMAVAPIAGDHARGTAAFLTSRAAALPDQPVSLGPSIDYLLSQSPGAYGTRLPSLQLATNTTGAAIVCDSSYPCAYQNSITWSGPDTPVPARVDPRSVFEAMFAGFDQSLTLVEQQRRYARRTSVLDHVLGDAARLRQRVSARDQERVDQYLTSVREIELRVLGAPPGAQGVACDPGEPTPPYFSYAEHLDLHIDLMVKAAECDVTRVISMMADASGSYRSFAFMGVPEAHHEMSHWNVTGEVDHRLAQWQQICAWHVARFGDLIRRLDATPDVGGGSLLDSSMVFFSSEVGDGNSHNHTDLPVLLAGSGCGRVLTGRHHRFASREPLANLFVGLLHAFGSTETTFGADGTRVMADVFA
jgi:hypothetical protein